MGAPAQKTPTTYNVEQFGSFQTCMPIHAGMTLYAFDFLNQVWFCGKENKDNKHSLLHRPPPPAKRCTL